MISYRALIVWATFAASLHVGVSADPVAVATDSPVATIAALQEGLIGAASSQTTVEERYRVLEPIILATHDLTYIAEFALRRQWGALSETDRQRFIAAFERLSVMTYAARFASVGPDTFREVTPGGDSSPGRARVSTGVARAGAADVSLDYLLEQGPEGWRIINIVADGVSDLALQRAEYQRVFASGGLEGLLAELDEQTQRLQDQRAPPAG
jgi:phospholipid transport system substrate-binding protein